MKSPIRYLFVALFTAGLYMKNTSAAGVFMRQAKCFAPLINVKPNIQKRSMASFWENPFTYAQRKKAEETREKQNLEGYSSRVGELYLAEIYAKKQEEELRKIALEKSNRQGAYFLKTIFDIKSGLHSGKTQDARATIEAFDRIIKSDDGQNALLNAMKRNSNTYSAENLFNSSLFQDYDLAFKIVPTYAGMYILEEIAKKNPQAFVKYINEIGDYYDNPVPEMIKNHKKNLENLITTNPSITQAFASYITRGLSKNNLDPEFVNNVIELNPNIVTTTNVNGNNNIRKNLIKTFNTSVNKDPLYIKLITILLKDSQAAEELAAEVGWINIERWQKKYMPQIQALTEEQLALPAEQLALPPASEENSRIQD